MANPVTVREAEREFERAWRYAHNAESTADEMDGVRTAARVWVAAARASALEEADTLRNALLAPCEFCGSAPSPIGHAALRGKWPYAACYTCCGKKYHSGARCRRVRGKICIALALITKRETEEHIECGHTVQEYQHHE